MKLNALLFSCAACITVGVMYSLITIFLWAGQEQAFEFIFQALHLACMRMFVPNITLKTFASGLLFVEIATFSWTWIWATIYNFLIGNTKNQ
jgi:hypothetical protein